jgi:XTP/dITP diphosphohydrolase
MTMIEVTYVTSSRFKREENEIFRANWTLAGGQLVNQYFHFAFRSLSITEVLEVSIEAMVALEVKAAYAGLKVPCIVEHAGLIFSDYHTTGYPGGLTKPMWNTLGDSFVKETHSAGRNAIARAAVAYCDGQRTHTFVGETHGRISPEPRGSRSFYWDTVFIPSDNNPDKLTYAEIVARKDLGLEYKVLQLSQSSKAMAKFLEWRLTNRPQLWQVSH